MMPQANSVDIALLLEGTYPYVRGGVSSWVHELILGFPDLRFGVVFLGSAAEAYAGIRYELPKNLVHLESHYLFQKVPVQKRRKSGIDPQAFTDIHTMLDAFARKGKCSIHLIGKIADHLIKGRIRKEHFQESHEAWEMVTTLYREYGSETSFLDYFWTLRSMQSPLWALIRIAQNLIPAQCYHSASTGYAGILGTLLSHSHHRPLILSEHGLYTKERKIDLLQSKWIRETGKSLDEEAAEGGTLRKLWIRFFEAMGKATYATANPVVSLYEGIRKQQIQDGADPSRAISIPNGIQIERLKPLRHLQVTPPNPIFSLIGRVVPIKDIKTFIRAMRIVKNQIPDAEGWIVGPSEEDSSYDEECRVLANSLAMDNGIQFLGFQKIEDILPKTAILVLSSISEALPLTLLEGFAAGLPAVATDVGSCRQLILGNENDPEDLAIGAAGRVVGICDPQSLAEALIGLFLNTEEWNSAKQSAMTRVERFYSMDQMLHQYREIYQLAMALPVSKNHEMEMR